MLIVNTGIYMEVDEKAAVEYLSKGYTKVEEEPKTVEPIDDKKKTKGDK